MKIYKHFSSLNRHQIITLSLTMAHSSVPSPSASESGSEKVVLVFEPDPAVVEEYLPPLRHVIPEGDKLHSGKKFLSNTKNPPQDGVRCPGCHLHLTKYRGFLKEPRKKKDSRRPPINDAEERSD